MIPGCPASPLYISCACPGVDQEPEYLPRNYPGRELPRSEMPAQVAQKLLKSEMLPRRCQVVQELPGVRAASWSYFFNYGTPMHFLSLSHVCAIHSSMLP